MGSTISLRCHGKGMTLNLPGTPIMEAAVVPESVCGTLIDTAFSDAGVSVECQQLVKAISQSLFHAAANHMEHLVSDKIIAVIYPGHLPGSCKALDFQLAGYPSDVYFYLSTQMTNYATLECSRIKDRKKEVYYVVCPLVTEYDALPPRGKIRIDRKRRKNPMIGVLQKMMKFTESLPDDAIVEMHAT